MPVVGQTGRIAALIVGVDAALERLLVHRRVVCNRDAVD